jgi:hypothetical protein
MSAFRPLPPRPSLEYERKEAKALLRRLRAADPEALARARARLPRFDAIDPTRVRLADAQLIIARDYGFVSWPRLVRYFGDVERQRHAPRQSHASSGSYEARVRGLIAEHRARNQWAGRTLAAYVPRFYGMSVEAVFAEEVSEDDARLAVARSNGLPSWEALLEELDSAPAARREDPWTTDPMPRARDAIASGDVDALARVVAEHPYLLRPTHDDMRRGDTLMNIATRCELKVGAKIAPVIQWLSAHGFDRQRELDSRLCGHMGMSPFEVHTLLDLGADANWIAPNGMPVLEHALLRYWNGDAVDVLAARATPRRALWIAAGLGDVAGVSDFFDRRGKLKSHARQLRPDFIAVLGPTGVAALPEADDDELLLEALLVAALNGRAAVVDYLASHGAPVNSLAYGSPLLSFAVGNGKAKLTECLLRNGADLDLRGRHPDASSRELARQMFEHDQSEERRRVLVLCGLDPDAVIAERDARTKAPPELDSYVQRAIAFAVEDAARLGWAEVRVENLFVGLLRGGGRPVFILRDIARMDVGRLREGLGARLRPLELESARSAPALSSSARTTIESATALATGRRADSVEDLHLLFAIARARDEGVVGLLAPYGGSLEAIDEAVSAGL